MKKIMFFRPLFYMGGTEIAILNLIKILDGYEIIIGYTDETSDKELLEDMGRFATIVNTKKSNIEVDTLIICSPYSSVIPQIENIKRENTYLWFHHFGKRDDFIFNDEKTFDLIDKIIVVSETTKKTLLEQEYGKKIKSKLYVIYNILKVREIREKAKIPIEIPKSDTLNLVTVSRLCFEKGFERIYILAKMLKEKNIDFKWYIIGGNYYKDVEEKIISMFSEFENNFIFFGFLENPFNIIKKSDYLVLLSDDETWGLVLTEAKILGVPCIVTNFDVAYEQIIDDKTGIILSKIDTDSYFSKIDYILENKQRLKENLKKFRFSNIQTINRWKKIL